MHLAAAWPDLQLIARRELVDQLMEFTLRGLPLPEELLPKKGGKKGKGKKGAKKKK